MDEYIKKNDLLELYTIEGFEEYAATLKVPILVIRQNIIDLPVEDVTPVVHGRWLDTGFFNSYKSPIYECSACHKEVYDHYIDCHKYCLHCGARMDGE